MTPMEAYRVRSRLSTIPLVSGAVGYREPEVELDAGTFAEWFASAWGKIPLEERRFLAAYWRTKCPDCEPFVYLTHKLPERAIVEVLASCRVLAFDVPFVTAMQVELGEALIAQGFARCVGSIRHGSESEQGADNLARSWGFPMMSARIECAMRF